jgi:hypothetical protein
MNYHSSILIAAGFTEYIKNYLQDKTVNSSDTKG